MSTPVVRVLNEAGDGCCPCPDQTGCGCNSSPYSCIIGCQSKHGIAQLCGFEEYTDPSSPPKLYRRQVVAGSAGTMDVCETFTTDECIVSPCPGQYDQPDVIVPQFCAPFDAHLYGFLHPQGPDGFGNIIFLCQSKSYASTDPTNIVPGTVIYAPTGGGSGGSVNDGATVALPIGGEYNCAVRTGFCFGITTPTKCLFVGGSELDGYADDWDITSQYSATTCAFTQTDNSLRYPTGVNTGPLCGKDLADPITIPCTGGPQDCYGSLAGVATERTLRTIAGLGCVDVGSGNFISCNGTVTGTLSDEDTIEDAIGRQNAGQEWVSGLCASNPAFITPRSGAFSSGYRSVRVNAQALSLTPGLHYTVTIRFYRRVCCGTGVWISFASHVFDIVATHVSEITPYVDVPNEEGFETAAFYCRVVLVP